MSRAAEIGTKLCTSSSLSLQSSPTNFVTHCAAHFLFPSQMAFKFVATQEEFLLDQIKVGSGIRLREGRGIPIDLLTKHLYPLDDLDVEIDEPDMVFKGLTVHELEGLYEDIKMHLDLDKATPRHMQYWQPLLVVCDWELSEARKRDSSDQAIRLLQGKSYRELEALRSQVEAQMQSGTAKVVEFWEVLLRRIDIFKGKACLEEIHAEVLSRHLQHLEKPIEFGDFCHDGKDVQVLLPQCTRREENPEKHRQELGAGPPAPDDNFEKKAVGAMEEGDAIFGWKHEINLDSQVYWWRAKYSPRKPKYFNRVHTGYEWNKYNRNHYDHDSPQPKIVQGYKFNIFYPDLADKEKAPTYAIEKDGNSLETCIIRFPSGPPYEDIAFRVVNKERDYSHKKGFKCTFGQGVLRLYFNFKRY
ncbi:unnamed protein product [Coffea canephora]|uniref:Splicing factor Cactin n=1 Tax=Coffea canephora TaxID=49390 RepID=A0A068TR33_COFCA|nr:unnamed protein product [Coffea canephora]